MTKGEKFYMKWKDIEIGILTGNSNPMKIQRKFKKVVLCHYQKRDTTQRLRLI